MAMTYNKTHCFTCNKDKITYPCEGCLKNFCLMDLTKHRQILNEELHHIINDYDQFKQRFNEQKPNPHDLFLIDQINQWEIDSIIKIQQKARGCREIVIKSSQTCINDIEMKFNDLNEQLKQFHSENEFNEINLEYLRNELIKMREELDNPSKISIQQDSQSFINEISIISLEKKPKFSKGKQNAITVAGGNEKGQQLNQLNRPHGIFTDKNKNIFIADSYNHRIVEWKHNAKQGQIIAGGNGEGDRIDQLYWKEHEVRRWKIGEYDNEGIIVAGGNGQGHKLDQLNYPTFIFVDEDQSVYVSDRYNHRVVKWRKGTKRGRIAAGRNGKGRNLNQLSAPEGVIVDNLGRIYVADSRNNRIMRWREGKKGGEIVVDGNGEGSQSNQLNVARGLSFDDEGNLYVVGSGHHRIQKFEIIV
ncbi:unnamed protein product [Adineta steineri]|uniref:NHL repeat containing protein n=1 Tax=Adineta steineri TaxID=433720 RepID=A0A819CLP0_9BILA|nr:unnamed protein product [Adineta steineri]